MTPGNTETAFALEGFLPLWAVIATALALIAVSVWMARRDAKFADRPRLVWGLLILRCTAVLILAWMLAGPTLVTTVRTLHRKTVSILVDASASMGLVDGLDGSANVSRWAAARETGGDARLIKDLDDGTAAMHAALQQLERFGKMPASTKRTDEARDLLSRAATTLETSTARLTRTVTDIPAAEVKSAASEALKAVQQKVLDVLPAKGGEFKRGKALGALEREKWLPQRIGALATAVAQLERVADEVAKAIETEIAKSPGDAANEEAKRTRFEKVQSFMSEAEQTWLRDIRRKASVVRYQFGEKVISQGTAPWAQKIAAAPPTAQATQVGSALQQVALDKTTRPVEAAILITDGGQNAGRDPREIAPSLAGTALHIVPIGNTRMQRDVIVHHTHAPKTVLQNDQVVLDSIVTAYDCDKEKLEVELLDNGVVVDRQSIHVTSEMFDKRVQLRWKAASLGKHSLALRVLPVSKERSEDNNAAKADVHVMEDRIRVLVADNFPRWETRYLLNLFKRDERIAFEQLLFEPQPAAGEGMRSNFPDTLEEWSRYRVVVLGDLLPSQLTPERQKMLRDYVTETGGNLIIIAGKDAMPEAYLRGPLGSLMPVDPGDRAIPGNQPFYLHLTDEGSMTLATQIADTSEMSERAWREMTERLPLYSVSEISKPKPTAHSLIWASMSKTAYNPSDAWTRTFMAWHYVGAGRVVYIAAPITYQLRYRQGDTYHHRFWGQLLRWAVARDLGEGSQTVRLSTDKSRYEQGESVQVSARLRQLDGRAVSGAACRLVALQDGKLLQEIALKEDGSRPGSYLGALEQLPTGPVRLELTGDKVTTLLADEKYRRPIETTVSVDPSGVLELRHPLCNLPLLREIADASGGMVVQPTGLAAALSQLNLEPEVRENVSKKPLWNRWDLFWLFIACLTLEWAGRKYVGLS